MDFCQQAKKCNTQYTSLYIDRSIKTSPNYHPIDSGKKKKGCKKNKASE